MNPVATFELNNCDHDGSSLNIKKCGNCDLCPNFHVCSYITSSNTGRSYKVVNEEFPQVVNCSSRNVIYLVTCSTCKLQYVGQTVSKVNIRFATHRRCMAGAANASSCKRLSEHFSAGKCHASDYSVHVIEKWQGDGRTPSEAVDWVLAKARRKKEDSWMLKLRTVWPYGLNDSLNEVSSNSIDDEDIIGKIFPSLPKKSNTPLRRTRNYHRQRPLNYTMFIRQMNAWLDQDLPHAAYNIRISLDHLNKKHLKKLADFLSDFLMEQDENFLYTQWYLMALDMIETKLFKPPIPVEQRKIPRYKLNLPFVNKALDYINLPQILRCDTVYQQAPQSVNQSDIPMVFYSLGKPVRSSLLNYNKFVSTLNLDSFCNNTDTVPCCCSNYDGKYLDPHHGHILTGNLDIINNNKLRKLFTRGPKFREPAKLDWEAARTAIMAALEIYFTTLSESKGISAICFFNWRQFIIQQVDAKISYFSPRINVKSVHPVLRNQDALRNLKQLQNDFVMVSIDKAANNIAFICKQLYASIILKELNYSVRPVTRSQSRNTDATYCLIQNTTEEIIQNHTETLQSNYNITVTDDMLSLPNMYWTPKLHKDPVGARFIIASIACSLKLISKDITMIFRLFFRMVQKYNLKTRIWSGVKKFWVIQNSDLLIQSINRINDRKLAKTVSTFDFSTLYTKIPHNLLIDSLDEIIDFVFRGGTAYLISVDDFKAVWVKKKNSRNCRVYSKDNIKQAVRYLISNSFFQVGGTVFRQTIGIPMGLDPAPFFANLFLYTYESKWLADLKKSDIRRARKFVNVFRFIDDLIALNDGSEFLRSFSNIYPKEMLLKQENDGVSSATFLDISIRIENKQFITELYDKRDAFNFSVVRFPHKVSNIPSKMFYSAISAEVLRISRATSDYVGFVNSARIFITRMKKQGAEGNSIKSFLRKMMNKHSYSFVKYRISPVDIILDIL